MYCQSADFRWNTNPNMTRDVSKLIAAYVRWQTQPPGNKVAETRRKHLAKKAKMETKIEETQFFPLSSHYIPILCHQAKLYSQQSGTLRNSAHLPGGSFKGNPGASATEGPGNDYGSQWSAKDRCEQWRWTCDMGVVGEYQQKSQNFGLMKIPTDPFLHFLDGQQGTKVTTGTHIKHCTTDRACGFYSSLTGRKDAWNSNTCHFWKHNGTQNSKHTLVWRALTFLGHSVCMGQPWSNCAAGRMYQNLFQKLRYASTGAVQLPSELR